MRRQWAVKRLTDSDLTLFEPHFRALETKGAGHQMRQKAINLNVSVFVNQLFPNLAGDRVRDVDATFHGPGGAAPIRQKRDIIKQQKNWRLDGKLLSNPAGQARRFDALADGDIALLEFVGEQAPREVSVVLVSASDPADAQLHKVLTRRLRLGPGVRSMVAVTDVDLLEAAEATGLEAGHPAYGLLEDLARESMAWSSGTAESIIKRRPTRRPVSRRELRDAMRRNEETGELGEALVDAMLTEQENARLVKGHEWASRSNAASPFDFIVRPARGAARLVDVKSTTGPFERPVVVPISELRTMAQDHRAYDVYRVYEIGETGAKIRIAHALRDFARSILRACERLPPGVTATQVEVRPRVLGFGRETDLSHLRVEAAQRLKR